MTQESRFKNASGNLLTRSLFFETTLADKTNVLYTLKNEDHKGYASLKRLYLETEDETEYEFANKYLEDYEHWKILCSCSWFKPYIEAWREELRLKLKARYLKMLKGLSVNDEKNSFAATKVLLSNLKEDLPKTKKAKKQQQEEALEVLKENKLNEEVAKDFARLSDSI